MNLTPEHIAALLESYKRRKKALYVIMTGDGSTLVQDPGLDRPWASPNRALAEFHAKEVQKATGRKCGAMPLDEAMALIIKHPKNQPSYRLKNAKRN
jgi:hypothetical protein